MPALGILQTSDCSNPVLDVWITVGGVLTDLYELSFQIFDRTSGSDVQIFPVVPGNKEPVDVGTDCPVGHRVSVGRYVAEWTVPGAANIGTHRVKWYFRLLATSPEQTFNEEFEVVSEDAASVLAGAYCTVAQLRAEGVPSEAPYTDDYLIDRILTASAYVDAVTARFFEPRELALDLDGTGAEHLLLDIPIIAVSALEILEQDITGVTPGEVDLDTVRIYNRHLTQRLTMPDDRASPKISFIAAGRSRYQRIYGYPLTFPKGVQNVRVTGVFGYTDYAVGVSVGVTPRLIIHVTKLLVMRELSLMYNLPDSCDDWKNRWRLKSEKTRDQSYTLEALIAQGGITGDSEIDRILAIYSNPIRVGHA